MESIMAKETEVIWFAVYLFCIQLCIIKSSDKKQAGPRVE